MRDNYIYSGMGFLKTLAGAYIIIIGGICFAAAKDAYNDPVKHNATAISNEANESYTVISCNGKTIPMNTSEYEVFINSDKDKTIVVDTTGKSVTRTVIHKDDVQELKKCDSLEEATNYINSLGEQRLSK